MSEAWTTFKVYVTPDEKTRIAASAKACRMSMSAFTRTLALGERPVSAIDRDATSKILKVSGDLGRLGGLLKMFLTNDERLNDVGRDFGKATIDGTLVDLRKTQAGLLELVDATVRKANQNR